MNEQIYMAAHAQHTYNQREAHLGHLPGFILRDIARNDAAPREWRKAAVEIMLEKGCPEVKHPELAELLREVKAHHDAKTEVQSVVESAMESPLDELNPGTVDGYKFSRGTRNQVGPFTAGFTTRSLYQDDIV